MPEAARCTKKEVAYEDDREVAEGPDEELIGDFYLAPAGPPKKSKKGKEPCPRRNHGPRQKLNR